MERFIPWYKDSRQIHTRREENREALSSKIR